MEFKEAPAELKPYVERARAFWANVDVGALQPVVHGPVPSEKEMAERANNLAKIQKLQQQYAKMLAAVTEDKEDDPIPES
jgi:hypothetical protein